MIEKQNLFADFLPLSKEEWEQKVLKELKGKPLEDLEWALGGNLKIEALYSSEEKQAGAPSLVLDRDTNDWDIGEDFWTDDPSSANKNALKALQEGINAPCFIWKEAKKDFDWKTLLHEIKASFVSTHLVTTGNHGSLLETFYQYQKEEGTSVEALEGSINGSLLRQPAEGMALLRFGIVHLPQFQLLSIDGRGENDPPEGVVEELAALLFEASETFFRAGETGLTGAEVAPRIQFVLNIGTSYFVELAKIRALRLLWPLLLKAYQVAEKVNPVIVAQLAPDTQIKDTELNMIRASTQAMSAVLGGANRLTILPANTFEAQSNDFTRRIARNVQHILKMESYLDRVHDPAAGSYYIEELTNQFATQAWKRFQEMENS